MIIDQLKETFRESVYLLRQVTWLARPLPNFIIIGAQKAGTSSLNYYLRQHSQVAHSSMKEIHFFDGGLEPNIDNFKKGLSWYRSHFPMMINTHQITFDATPLYLFSPIVPKRLSESLPDVKLIAILRNPTERAISHYFHERKLGYEKLPIMDALLAEEDRLRSAITQQDYKNKNFIHYSYKNRGHYFEQINRYLKFFSINNILVLNSEDFFSKPESTLRHVFQFIGVDENFLVQDLMVRNPTKNKTEVDPEVYDYLDQYFDSHNHLLYELLGKNFDW